MILLPWAGVLLVPLFLLIGVAGGRNRRRAARWFFGLTFATCLLLALGPACVAAWNGRIDAHAVSAIALDKLAVLAVPLGGDATARLASGFAMLVGFGLATIVARGRPEHRTIQSIAVFAAVAGFVVTAVASNLVLLVVGLETVAFAAHAMLLANRPDRREAEVRLKYVLLGVLASALWLYGLTFVRGMAGSTDLDAIRAAMSAPRATGGPIDATCLSGVAGVLLVAGLCIKTASVPFHLHVADVLRDATHGTAAFLAVLPKAAAAIVLLRVLVAAMPGGATDICLLTAGLAVLGMTHGNLMAIRETHLRRLLAHVSIAETGFLLLGVSVSLAASDKPMPCNPSAAVLFHLAASSVALLGTFAVLARLESLDRPIDDVEQLAGLRRSHPALAAALGVFLLSLMGMPPLAGFWNKMALLAGAFEIAGASTDATLPPRTWPIALAVVAGVNMALAAVYSGRMLDVICFRLPLTTPRGTRGLAIAAVVAGCVLLTVLFPFLRFA